MMTQTLSQLTDAIHELYRVNQTGYTRNPSMRAEKALNRQIANLVKLVDRLAREEMRMEGTAP